MDAFIWREFEGDRGANNIVSCLLKCFQMKQFFYCPNFGELTLIADSCGGQNKNRVMLRGHTKNSADRCFNLVKGYYSKSNIYTYDELHAAINANPLITAHKMLSSGHEDHQKWQDSMYRDIDKGVKESH
eukprot:15365121-Ditylum_brightwellii.AAC.2